MQRKIGSYRITQKTSVRNQMSEIRNLLSSVLCFLWLFFLFGCDFGLNAPTEDANGIYLNLLSNTKVDGNILLVQGNKAYVMGYYNRFRVFDISDKLNPEEECNTDLRYINAAKIRGSYIYAIRSYNKFIVINVSSSSSPEIVSELELEYKAEGVEIDANYAYVRAGNYLLIIDISSPTNPVLVKTMHFPNKLVGCVVENKIGYIASQDLIITYDFSDPTNPIRLFETGRYLENLKKNGGYLYGISHLGMNVIKIHSPRELQYVRWIKFPGVVVDFDFDESHPSSLGRDEYGVATDNSTLYLLDITKPSFPCVTEKMPGGGNSLIIYGDYIYYLRPAEHHNQYFTILKIEHIR